MLVIVLLVVVAAVVDFRCLKRRSLPPSEVARGRLPSSPGIREEHIQQLFLLILVIMVLDYSISELIQNR